MFWSHQRGAGGGNGVAHCHDRCPAASAQPEKGQDEHYYDNEANEINQPVHNAIRRFDAFWDNLIPHPNADSCDQRWLR
jgi:hypothetical protein